jgi:NADH:ubiquinone oxidoreductase subunit F (NADH-binding)
MRELIFEHGGGPPGGRAVKAVFPGGVSSRALGGEALDLRLDYDSVLDAGSDLGSGTMIVVPEETSMVDLAVDLQGFLHESSCGKCQPCKDGTRRTLTMLRNIEHIDQRSIDLMDKERPESPRKRGGLYVIQEDEVLGGLSYTDVAQGLGKITSLCQFYEHRGDCHHSKEASRVMRRLIELFADEFEARIAPAEIAQESTA